MFFDTYLELQCKFCHHGVHHIIANISFLVHLYQSWGFEHRQWKCTALCLLYFCI